MWAREIDRHAARVDLGRREEHCRRYLHYDDDDDDDENDVDDHVADDVANDVADDMVWWGVSYDRLDL